MNCISGWVREPLNNRIIDMNSIVETGSYSVHLRGDVCLICYPVYVEKWVDDFSITMIAIMRIIVMTTNAMIIVLALTSTKILTMSQHSLTCATLLKLITLITWTIRFVPHSISGWNYGNEHGNGHASCSAKRVRWGRGERREERRGVEWGKMRGEEREGGREYVCVFVCACEREREREREGQLNGVIGCVIWWRIEWINKQLNTPINNSHTYIRTYSCTYARTYYHRRNKKHDIRTVLQFWGRDNDFGWGRSKYTHKSRQENRICKNEEIE